MSVVIVYVHGLWLPGGESLLLRRRLSRALNAETRVFSYPSVTATATDNALALGRYLQKIPADTLHLVAHSMGGLLILKLFELGTTAVDVVVRGAVDGAVRGAVDGAVHGAVARGAGVASAGSWAGVLQGLAPGRIVLTGSPVRGSRSAGRLAQLPLGRTLLGLTAAEVLLPRREARWAGARDLGVIAGDLGLGLGRLLGKVDEPSDGTVWVSETDLPAATDQIRLHVSHSGMVFSAAVARQTAAFLQNGRFER